MGVTVPLFLATVAGVIPFVLFFCSLFFRGVGVFGVVAPVVLPLLRAVVWMGCFHLVRRLLSLYLQPMPLRLAPLCLPLPPPLAVVLYTADPPPLV